MAKSPTNLFPLLFFLVHLLHASTAQYTIGVNYGTLGDNLQPPAKVATFLKERTIIDRIKIFDANPDILKSFANSGIAVTVTVANGDIPQLIQLPVARNWVDTHIAPFHPKTKINRIIVGNEILHSLDDSLISNLVPAMKMIHQALLQAGIKDVQITTAHSLGILLKSQPPSTGQFRPGWDVGVLAPMLQFHRETKSPFMVNPYPYFGYSPKLENYALFKPNRGRLDRYTNITYTNMFDAQLDAVYSSMKKLGYGDVDIVVGETGWPSVAEPNQPGVSLDAAATYNGNLVKHINSGKGTPLMPKRKFEAFIFGLFNENLKPGPNAERNFGLFWPDFTPVYDAGILRGQQFLGKSPSSAPSMVPESSDSPTPEVSGPVPEFSLAPSVVPERPYSLAPVVAGHAPKNSSAPASIAMSLPPPPTSSPGKDLADTPAVDGPSKNNKSAGFVEFGAPTLLKTLITVSVGVLVVGLLEV